MTLIETANSATVAVVKGKQAQIGESHRAYVTQGVRNNVWSEPFFNVPKELGPYAYSTFNVRLDTIQKEPETGARLRARHGRRALKFLYANTDECRRDRQEAVPHHAARRPQGDARPLVRGRDVEQGRHDQHGAWDTGKAVVREAGILKRDVKYDEIIDMSFVNGIKA